MSTSIRRAWPVPGFGVLQALLTVVVVATLVAPALAAPRRAAAASWATTTSALNLRTGPSTKKRIKLVIPGGADVRVDDGPRYGFYKVVYSGVGGWAHGDYLDFDGGGGGDDDGGGGGGGTAVVQSALNLRTGPSTSSGVILVMSGGATVELTGESSNGFLGVVYRGTAGWAHGSYLGDGGGDDDGGSPPTGDGDGTATVRSALNLRAGPSTADRVLAVMPGGATVELTGDSANGFLGVIYNGQRGWGYADYLNTGGGGDDGGGVDGSDGWSTDEIITIIYAAADRYGQSREDMLRVARCESGLDPYNVTPPYSASGLFQFLPSTWASTPYANEDIFDPIANANATGWMWSVGRRGEWVCQ